LHQQLSGAGPESADVEALRVELAELKAKVSLLSDENEDLRTRVLHFLA